MRMEQILAITGTTAFTETGPKAIIGNAPHHAVGDMVWTDGRVIFGHQAVKNTPIYIPVGEEYIVIFNGSVFTVINVGTFKTVLQQDISSSLLSEIGNGTTYFAYNKRKISILISSGNSIKIISFVNGVRQQDIIIELSITPTYVDLYIDDEDSIFWAALQFSDTYKAVYYKNSTMTDNFDLTGTINALKNEISNNMAGWTTPIANSQISPPTDSYDKGNQCYPGQDMPTGGTFTNGVYLEFTPDANMSPSASLLAKSIWEKEFLVQFNSTAFASGKVQIKNDATLNYETYEHNYDNGSIFITTKYMIGKETSTKVYEKISNSIDISGNLWQTEHTETTTIEDVTPVYDDSSTLLYTSYTIHFSITTINFTISFPNAPSPAETASDYELDIPFNYKQGYKLRIEQKTQKIISDDNSKAYQLSNNNPGCLGANLSKLWFYDSSKIYVINKNTGNINEAFSIGSVICNCVIPGLKVSRGDIKKIITIET